MSCNEIYHKLLDVRQDQTSKPTQCTQYKFFHWFANIVCLQCFDTVGWVAGRASSL